MSELSIKKTMSSVREDPGVEGVRWGAISQDDKPIHIFISFFLFLFHIFSISIIIGIDPFNQSLANTETITI